METKSFLLWKARLCSGNAVFWNCLNKILRLIWKSTGMTSAMSKFLRRTAEVLLLQSYAAGIFMMMHVEWPELTREDKKALAEIEGWEQARAWGFRLLGYRTKHRSRFFLPFDGGRRIDACGRA